MFDEKENWIGVLLVGICLAVAGVLLWEIFTGNRLSYNGPAWLAWVLFAVVIGGSFYGLFQSISRRRKSGGAPQWPSPSTGQKSWWDRLRGR